MQNPKPFSFLTTLLHILDTNPSSNIHHTYMNALLRHIPMQSAIFCRVYPAYHPEDSLIVDYHGSSKKLESAQTKLLTFTKEGITSTTAEWIMQHLVHHHHAPETFPFSIESPTTNNQWILPITSPTSIHAYLIINKPDSPPHELSNLRILIQLWAQTFHTHHLITEKNAMNHTLKQLNCRLEKQLSSTITKLQTSNQELRSLTLHLEDQVETEISHRKTALQKAEKLAYQASLSTLSLGISHEINNPLAIIKAELDFLKEELSDPNSNTPLTSLHPFLQLTEKNIDRILTIIQTMTRYGLKRSGTQASFNIQSFLTDFKLMTQNLCHKANTDLIVDIPSTPIWIKAEDIKLNQLFLNLVNNSIHAIQVQTPKRGSIKLKHTLTPSKITFTIQDNGCGIPKKEITHILKPFYSTKPKTGGKNIGLGLSICQQIVNNHQGTLTIESVIKKGTTFEIEFPRIQTQHSQK